MAGLYAGPTLDALCYLLSSVLNRHWWKCYHEGSLACLLREKDLSVAMPCIMGEWWKVHGVNLFEAGGSFCPPMTLEKKQNEFTGWKTLFQTEGKPGARSGNNRKESYLENTVEHMGQCPLVHVSQLGWRSLGSHRKMANKRVIGKGVYFRTIFLFFFKG